jgi:hypothetical protein
MSRPADDQTAHDDADGVRFLNVAAAQQAA